MTERQTTEWDPQDATVLADQRAAYDEMRERCPVAHSDFLGWSLFSHQDVAAAVSDPNRFSSATKRQAIPNGMDPPDHTAYRGALEQYFSQARMASFEPRSRQIAADLLAPLADRCEIEAIEEFVNPFAHQAVCAFMGWPVQDWNRVSDWTHGNQEAAFRGDRKAGARLATEFDEYVTAILRERRADPNAIDLMGELVRTSVRGRLLTDEQIVSALRTWTAGHGTVASALGIVVLHLGEHADLQDRLRAEPRLLDAAIGEILRADGPLVANNRTATTDLEVGGQVIRKGQRVSLMWIAANRDPATFAQPDQVDLDRDPAPNLLFGAGLHRCLGEPLARQNLRLGLEQLLQRLGRFELAGPGDAPRHVVPSNGLSALALRVQPRGVIGANGR